MIRIAGHTVGTPQWTVAQAAEHFARWGLEAIEIRVDDSGCALPLTATPQELADLKGLLARLGLAVAAVTPYMCGEMNTLDVAYRRQQVEALKQSARMAEALGARVVRAIGGRVSERRPDGRGISLKDWDACFLSLVEGLYEAGEFALTCGVSLAIENHFGYMGDSAAETMAIVNAVHLPSVAVLYDQGNLDQAGSEPYSEALPLQAAHIVHVHAKDHAREADGRLRPVPLGRGLLPWREMITMLQKTGYRGYMSIEFQPKGPAGSYEEAVHASLRYLRGEEGGIG